MKVLLSSILFLFNIVIAFGQKSDTNLLEGNRYIKFNILLLPPDFQQWRIQYERVSPKDSSKSNMTFFGYNCQVSQGC
jgi:hypothetical protein